MTPLIRPISPSDAHAWARMRHALWPDGSLAEHADEIEKFFSGQSREPLAVLFAINAAGDSVGFVELSIRPFAEGCKTGRVAYLEGWFVALEARRKGIGRLLVEAAESWAREQHCTELASDSEWDNSASIAAHRAAGFMDAGLVRCFKKDL